jgi:hypothetical protein
MTSAFQAVSSGSNPERCITQESIWTASFDSPNDDPSISAVGVVGFDIGGLEND